jgi:hypothetical protein
MKPLLILCLPVLLTNVMSAQNRYDVVITEIMSDPSPSVGLPSNEWIELKNNSTSAINLQGWRIADQLGQSGEMPDYRLEANSYVIVCANSALAAMSAFGNTISVTSFPSLDNDGELLMLKNATGVTIHAIEYSTGWFQNELKKDGGWTLEMIDAGNPCNGGSNWSASINAAGGTPGSSNSVSASNPDGSAPELKSAFVKEPASVSLVFNEPLDSATAAQVGNYSATGINFINAEVVAPLFNTVVLTTITGLQPGTIYHIVCNNITDCAGNKVASKNTARVGLPVPATAGDAVINEILFNPRSNAYDYVEFFNKSNKILDISKLYVASRNSSNAINSITQISVKPTYFFPGEYIIVTVDAGNLALNYLVINNDVVFTRSSLPSFPDDEGDVLLLNEQGGIIDEVHYSDDWHFKLLSDVEGVSLERVDTGVETQNAGNWHSAASTAGYGTPGYQNSQLKNLQPGPAIVEINPKVFSPDNDGFDDLASIQYKVTEPGFVANVTIFDGAGRPVRNLVQNNSLSISGYWNWDGLNDKGLRLPVGTYIVFIEIFNLAGKKQSFKKALVLARKF